MNEAEFVSSSERPMGTENQYEIDHEAECPSCGKSYKIMGTICEYPVLALNYDDTEIKW